MIPATLVPPVSTGTSVGAPPRVLLERANSTLKGVRMSRVVPTVAPAISRPGSPIRDPNAKMPTLPVTLYPPSVKPQTLTLQRPFDQ